MTEAFCVRVEGEAFCFGQTLRGQVVFADSAEGSWAEKLQRVRECRLVAQARVHGSGDAEVIVIADEVLFTGPPAKPIYPFTVKLPRSGPVSWQGRHVKVDWELVARLDVPWALDPKARCPFQLRAREWGPPEAATR